MHLLLCLNKFQAGKIASPCLSSYALTIIKRNKSLTSPRSPYLISLLIHNRPTDKNYGGCCPSDHGTCPHGRLHCQPNSNAQICRLPRGDSVPHVCQHYQPRRDAWDTLAYCVSLLLTVRVGHEIMPTANPNFSNFPQLIWIGITHSTDGITRKHQLWQRDTTSYLTMPNGSTLSNAL